AVAPASGMVGIGKERAGRIRVVRPLPVSAAGCNQRGRGYTLLRVILASPAPEETPMQPVVTWLKDNEAKLVRDLAELVAIRSISTDFEHQKEIDQSAEKTCALMRDAGLHNVATLRSGDSNPYAYGEWLGAPGKPTVFLYAHHDVQPVNFVGTEQWQSDPWVLTERDGRLYGRGAADDKGAIV